MNEEAKKWILDKDAGGPQLRCASSAQGTTAVYRRSAVRGAYPGTFTTRPAFIEVYLEGERLFYRQVGEGAENTDGVLLYSA